MKFDLVWAEHWTFVPFLQADNRISGHRARKKMAAVRIYAYTVTHRMFANARISQIREAVDKVSNTICNSFKSQMKSFLFCFRQANFKLHPVQLIQSIMIHLMYMMTNRASRIQVTIVRSHALSL